MNSHILFVIVLIKDGTKIKTLKLKNCLMHTFEVDLPVHCFMSGINDLRKVFKLIYRTSNPFVNRLSMK